MQPSNNRADHVKASRRGVLTAGGGAALTSVAGLAAPAAAAARTEELTWLPAWRLRELMVARQVTALAVTEHFLARIANLDPQIHAFRQYDADLAREQARAADRGLAEGRTPGLLHGVPVGIKDHIAVRGLPLIAGMGAIGPAAARDSVVAERLRKAGAVIVGNLINPGMGAPAGQPLDSHPRNPWNLARVPGSSSAGPAAAVAGGLLPLAIGSDGGGSTRLPAAYCGLVGVHPTQGRVPAYNYGERSVSFLGTIGPIARDARDAAITLQVLAGPDGRATISSILGSPPNYLASLGKSLKGLKAVTMDHLGFGEQYAVAETPQVAATVRQAVQGLSELGVTVTARRGTWSDPRTWSTPINSMSGIPGALPATDAQIEEALDKREEYRAQFAALLSEFDVLVLPTSQQIAPELGPWSAAMNTGGMAGLIAATRIYTANTLMFNFLQMPAISVPCGFVQGMPVGMQLVGLPDSDPRLLGIAHAWLTRFPQTRRPELG